MSLADDMADAIVRQAVAEGPTIPVLCAVIRAASRIIAEKRGHDFAAVILSQTLRFHASKQNALGVRRVR